MALAETQYGKFYYFATDAIGQRIASGAFWDVHFRSWLDALHSESVFVDVGANIGFFSVYTAKRGVKVWAFEASPEVYDLLRRNIELNSLTNVHVENIALYDKEITLKLNPEWNDWPKLADGKVDYEHHNNSGGMSLVANGAGPYNIQARTLDSYNLPQCDLIKSDTQGADVRVLMGAEQTIRKFHPVILFEIEPIPARLHGDSVDVMYSYFDKLKYKVDCVNHGEHGQQDFVAVYNG